MQDDAAWNSNDRRVRRHVFDDHRVRADFDVVADRDVPQDRSSRADGDVIAKRRVPLGMLQRRAAERDALIDRHVVTDDGRAADNHAGAVVNEKPPADRRAGMNIDPGRPMHELGDESRENRDLLLPERVNDAMDRDRVEAGIRQQDVEPSLGGGVALNGRAQIGEKRG